MLPSSGLELPDNRRGITAAANATASWVRAQRAKRSDPAAADHVELEPGTEPDEEHPFQDQNHPSAVERVVGLVDVLA